MLIHTYIHIISCDCFYWSFPLHYSWFPWFGKRFGFELGISQHIIRSFIFFPLTCLLAFLSLFCFVPWYIMIWKKQILFFSNPNLKFSEIQNFHVWVLNMHQSAAYLGTKKISSSLSPMFPHGGNEGIGCVIFQAFILYY